MHNGQPIDPTTHISYQRLALKLVERIVCLLRPDEIDDCAQQFTAAMEIRRYSARDVRKVGFYFDIRHHFAQEAAPRKEGNNHVHD